MVQALRSKASDNSIKRPFSRISVRCPDCKSRATMWFSVFSRYDEHQDATIVIDDYRCLECGELFAIHTKVTV